MHNKKLFVFFISFFLIKNLLLAQGSIVTPQYLIGKINYAIITGQENLSDSLLKELSSKLNTGQEDQSFKEVLLICQGLHYAYFHYDYLLDSLFILQVRSDNSHISHLQKLIECEHYFNNADWEKTAHLSMEFGTEEISLDDKYFNPLFSAISLSNVFISRDNLLLNFDSLMAKEFISTLNILFKNSIDSLNNGMLIKLYWAANIINPSSPESKKLNEILWKKLLTLSNEDVAYFESILSTYNLEKHSYYEQRNNLWIYDGLASTIIANNKSYFIRNKWFHHLLNFGLFGDNLNEKKYFDIELKYNHNQKNISPYYIGQRLIQYGIFYGDKNHSISSSYFTAFFEKSLSDSNFNHYNLWISKLAKFEYFKCNHDPKNRLLIALIEKNNFINKNNSKKINRIYSMGYIQELAINNEFDKVDSLLKFDNLISTYSAEILKNHFLIYLRAYQTIKKSFNLKNYLNLKNEIVNFVEDGSITSITSPDLIEYASYFNDIRFGDSLLNKYELHATQVLKDFNIQRLRITDLSVDYLERSYITLYNKTQNKSYLIRLINLKLLKDNLIKNISSFKHQHNNAIDSIQRLLVMDDGIKSFKMITNIFDTTDYNYFIIRKTKFNLLIDSLLSDSSNLYSPILDSANLFNSFLNNLNPNKIILLGLASRKKSS